MSAVSNYSKSQEWNPSIQNISELPAKLIEIAKKVNSLPIFRGKAVECCDVKFLPLEKNWSYLLQGCRTNAPKIKPDEFSQFEDSNIVWDLNAVSEEHKFTDSEKNPIHSGISLWINEETGDQTKVMSEVKLEKCFKAVIREISSGWNKSPVQNKEVLYVKRAILDNEEFLLQSVIKILSIEEKVFITCSGNSLSLHIRKPAEEKEVIERLIIRK